MSNRQSLHPGLNIGHSDPEAHRAAEPVMFGFWVFLMSDLILFALLLVTYSVMSQHGLAGGPTPKDVTDLRSAGIETGLLLLSSFTFGMASLALKYREDTKRLQIWLAVTGLLGLAFIGMEVRDFAKLAAEGSVPQRSGFLSAHFTLLGMHMLHVASGIVWLLIMMIYLAIRSIDRMAKLRIMRLALFWHMLDIVWIAIVTFVFLFGAVG